MVARLDRLLADLVPYVASYNAQLFKQLSPEMVAYLRSRYPLPR